MSLLLQPIQIGPLTLRNRIVFPPMSTGYEERGAITPRSRNFYATLARGGAALLVLGDVSIQPAISPVPALHDDRLIPGLQTLTEAVHAEGALISAQLFHQEYDAAEIMRLMQTEGRDVAFKRLREDMQSFCNRITVEQIEQIQELFVAAARRAQAAGFDMIQIHGDRLIGMFCSPIINQRTDAYGGSPENRARFALEVTRKIHAAVPEMPLDYKLAIIRTDPPMGKGGPTLAEAQALAPQLVEAGVSAFHVALANHTALAETIPAAGTQPYGCFVDLAAAIKQVVSVPVTAVGRIITPDFAEGILAAGQADLIAMGRQLLCDPDLPRKLATGRAEEIRYCIMCNRGCTDNLTRQKSVQCVLNAALGGETTPEIIPTDQPKRVLVVGGGPGGLEAARVAALRGHRVTLVEKSGALGGQLKLATVPPCKDELQRAADYLIAEVQRLGVEIRLNEEATAESILAWQPESVILATGAQPVILPVPGHDRENVITAWDVLASAPVGDQVVVIGGNSVGLETAEYLALQGKTVAVVKTSEQIGVGESPTVLPRLQKSLQEHGVQLLTQHTLTEITAEGVVLVDSEGTHKTVACDTVVMAAGARPLRALQEALTAHGVAFCCVGDCAGDQARQLGDAIHEAFAAALAV